MKEKTTAIALATGLMLAMAVAAGAQDAQRQGAGLFGKSWTGRGFVSVNGGYQPASRDVPVNVRFDLYEEAGSVTGMQTVKGSGAFDVGGAYRVWRNLAAGLAITGVSQKADVPLTATVPHPLFVGQPRIAAAIAAGARHSEMATHLQAVWMLPLWSRLQVAVSGGPTIFSVKHDLIFVRETAFVEGAFPYGAVTVSSVGVERQSKSAVGYNVGGDVTYLLTPRLGAGLLLRYSGASVSLQRSGQTEATKLDVGGFQVGAGVRVRF
jgi:hypothetical protein